MSDIKPALLHVEETAGYATPFITEHVLALAACVRDLSEAAREWEREWSNPVRDYVMVRHTAERLAAVLAKYGLSEGSEGFE